MRFLRADSSSNEQNRASEGELQARAQMQESKTVKKRSLLKSLESLITNRRSSRNTRSVVLPSASKIVQRVVSGAYDKSHHCEGVLEELPRHAFDDFEYMDQLGRGAYGEVILSRERHSEELFAAKILEKKSRKFNRERGELEARVLRSSNHPFIIGFKCSFETEDKLYLIMEYASGGSLQSELSRVSERLFSSPSTDGRVFES